MKKSFFWISTVLLCFVKVETLSAEPFQKTSPPLETKEHYLKELKEMKESFLSKEHKLSQENKALVDSAMARFNKWEETIKSYDNSNTRTDLSVKSAKSELDIAKKIVEGEKKGIKHYLSEAKEVYEEFKKKLSLLSGDAKKTAEAFLFDIKLKIDDLEKRTHDMASHHLLQSLESELKRIRRFFSYHLRKLHRKVSRHPEREDNSELNPHQK